MKWTDIEEIAEALEEEYPGEDIYSLRFTRLFKLIKELKGFSDDSNRVNEKLLEAIQATWITLRNESS